MQLLTDRDLQKIDAHLARVIDRHLDAPGLAPLREKIRDYVLAGGKRVRPQLTAWTYRLASGDELLSQPTLDVAAGWELFHAFLLVHDDIIDGSARRRDRAALHHQLASLDSDSPRFGINLGIVAGDLLFSAAMCLWHDIELDDAGAHRDLLKLFSRVACTTGFGQAIDICASHEPVSSLDADTLLREYGWKTAAYTFEGPMLSGAILAGLGNGPRTAISRFALAVGQAYQLQNDLDDLAMPAHAGCDLVEGKRTLALLEYRASLEAAEQSQLDHRLDAISAADGEAIVMAEALRRQIVSSESACAGTRAMIETLMGQAFEAAEDASLPPALGAGMSALLQQFRTADAEKLRVARQPMA